MAKSQSASNKNDLNKKRQQKREQKEQRKAERKAGKSNVSFEDMLAYVDEDGNITSTPPDPTKKKVIKEEDIVLGSRNIDTGEGNQSERQGRVTFFNDAKGYGFIRDEKTQESIFVHSSSLTIVLRENDRVSFETQPGQKGPMAVNVKKI